MSYGTTAKLVAEGLGSALLVATVVGSGIMAEALSAGNLAVALLGNTIATGAMLYVLITMLGPVSGAHFNPLVSAVFVLRRDLSGRLAAGFVVVQVGGAVAGTLMAHAMFGQSLWQVSAHLRDGPSQILSEAVATFTLVLTILGTLRSRPEAVPVSVALVIVAGYWFTASTSFANPTVTLARALSDSFAGIAPSSVPGFVAGQVLGAVAAWLLAERVLGWRASPAEAPSLSGGLEP